MKSRQLSVSLSPAGILRWSTICILAGGIVSCDRGVSYVATDEDVKMAESQTQVEKLDSEKESLTKGIVANNFHLPRVGYYHAQAQDFFIHPYGYAQDGKYYVDGRWQDEPGASTVASSHPSPEALKKVDEALTEEQKTASSNSGQTYHSGGGFGMGNALMMYWMLSGNRGLFSPGAGFRQAGGQVGNWQRGVDDQRSALAGHASANPGYARMVQQSRASGAPVRAGQSVRGGFGSSRSSSSSISG